MPIHEYTCSTCKTSWEAIVRFDQRDQQFCPTCNDIKGVERLLSVPSTPRYYGTSQDGWHRPNSK